MATFRVSNKNKKSKGVRNTKKICGVTLIAVFTLVFLFSVTSLIAPLQYFFLGTFGLFVYPLSILMMIIGLALLNDKKYVMPKRYAILLSLSIFFLLAIIQLIILGEPKQLGEAGEEYLTFGEYLALSYTKQYTAGGIIIGFFVTCLVMPLSTWATGIILGLGLLISGAFFAETVLNMKKNKEPKSQVKIQIKEKEKQKPLFNPREKVATKKPKQEEPNIVLGGNIEEELTKEQLAKKKLGLLGSQPSGYKYSSGIELPPEPKQEKNKIPEGMSIREYLLSPPTVDMNDFISKRPRQIKPQNTTNYTQQNNFQQQTPYPTTSEINKAVSEMKTTDNIKPSHITHEENYDFTTNEEPIKRHTLPEVKPEQITSEAENIIRSVVEEEKAQIQEEMNFDDAFDTSSFIDDQSSIYDEVKTNEQTFTRSDREQIASRDRNEFMRREENQTQNFTRDRSQMLERNDRMDRASTFDRTTSPSERMQSNNSSFDRPDPIEKRKRFVELDSDEKPPEVFKPYKYSRPSLDLITTQSDDLSMFNEEIPMKRVALENALEKFGVPAKVQSVVIGPTVTRYEIAMPEGISVKKILSLDADIAYALSAKGQIRIEAPIPGRSIVGIEVPNSKVAKVSIKDVLQSKEFAMSPSPLTFALGKDIAGAVRVCNLQKMPHLLVAGTTGSGKSVCLNSIIISILYKSAPDEVKFIMIDPKQVELSMYEGLPHMVVPKVITDANKAVNALGWAVDEMERRFNLIGEARVRNIGEYNMTDEVKNGKKKKMPYLVIIFDEFADFMVEHKNEIEGKIQRLAQKARAAGIHLILATQRPSTDVVTGTIKANFPARIAFKVAGRVDGEVILGSTGAEKLLGYGDMLYKPSDTSPQRLQGCFIDTPETKDIVNYIIENNEEQIDTDAQNAINGMNKNSSSSDNGNDGVDPMLPQALKICIDNGVASTTMVQRKLSIGYPRAARIIDQMEERGYISTAEGSKQRTVYTTIEEFYKIFGDNYD